MAKRAETNPRRRVAYSDELAIAWKQLKARRSPGAPTVVSTFAGAGGSSLGYGMAGFKELLTTDWDAHSCACLRENKLGKKVIEGDICELSPDRIFEMTGLLPRELDVLDGSPPCQGFSTIGHRLIDDERNALFRHFCRLLDGMQPRAFVMENVTGMVKGHMKLVFAEILRELRSHGYYVRAWVMNAKWFGVPQSRERVIFVGFRDDLDVDPAPPGPTIERPYSMAEALEVDGVEAVCVYGSDRRMQRLDLGGPSPTIAAIGIGKYWKTGYFIRAEEGPRSSVIPPPNGMSKKTKLRLKGGAGFRRLSIGEVMRLQSFPDLYSWPKGTNWQSAWTRLGNSVPPLMMRAIAKAIREQLPDG